MDSTKITAGKPHLHAAMIKAKADNMDLVVFANAQHGKDHWYVIGDGNLPVNSRYSYFLCLPQHKEACLHWLNGGEVECRSNLVGNEWTECYPLGKWHSGLGLMREDAEYRIKPRKEKRWIGVFKSKSLLSGETEYHNTELSYESVDELKRDVHAPHGFNGWQFIEIEVEI